MTQNETLKSKSKVKQEVRDIFSVFLNYFITNSKSKRVIKRLERENIVLQNELSNLKRDIAAGGHRLEETIKQIQMEVEIEAIKFTHSPYSDII